MAPGRDDYRETDREFVTSAWLVLFFRINDCTAQVPIKPPSARWTTTVAARGRPSDLKSGQLDTARGAAGSLRSLVVVHARLQRLLGGAVARVPFERELAGRGADRVAPRVQPSG